MNEQPVPATRMKLFGRPGLPNGLVSLTMLLLYTHIAALLMNQPAGYWLDPRYASNDLPLSFLLSGGPLLSLAAAGLYLAVTGLLLSRLRAPAGLLLAAALALAHSLALYRTTTCGFYPLFELNGSMSCYTVRYILLVLFSALFALSLLVESLPDWLLLWGKRISIPVAALWIVLMGYGVFKAAFPPPSPWKPLAPAHSPGPRTLTAVAYDSHRQRAVLFGGVTVWDGSEWVYDNSTWEWDGQDWQKMNTAVAPTGRILHAMAYDEERGKVFLYGGQNNSGTLADLWEWDGTRWYRLCPVCNPARRFGHKMVFDAGRQETVIYGGQEGQTGYDEAWTWDGQAWEYFSFESSAPAVYNAPLVYDQGSDRTISFMGGDWGGTWIWEANTWFKLDPSVQPPVRDEAILVYDPVHDHIVLFGGFNGNDDIRFNDTWVFRAETWAKLDTPRAPLQRHKSVAFYDPVRQSIILYGGEKLESVYSDMWELVLPGGIQ